MRCDETISGEKKATGICRRDGGRIFQFSRHRTGAIIFRQSPSSDNEKPSRRLPSCVVAHHRPIHSRTPAQITQIPAQDAKAIRGMGEAHTRHVVCAEAPWTIGMRLGCLEGGRTGDGGSTQKTESVVESTNGTNHEAQFYVLHDASRCPRWRRCWSCWGGGR